MSGFRIQRLSERSASLVFDGGIDPAVSARVWALARALEASPFPGFFESVPAYDSLTVFFDPGVVMRHARARGAATSETLIGWLTERVSAFTALEGASGPAFELPVCYHPRLGVDLPEVARLCRMGEREVVALHVSRTYRVYMIGFLPGFPYMGVLPSALEVPRKRTPSSLVPAGSVALAGRQTGIYPLESPGGWQVIARTPLRLFDRDRQPASLLRPGMEVRFREISLDEFDNHARPWQ